MKSGAETTLRIAVLILGVVVMLHPWLLTEAQTASSKTSGTPSYQVDVAATKVWVDTNINVLGGAKLRFTATGKITYPPDASYEGKARTLGTFGPAGLARGWADLIHQYAVSDAGHGALIGRIGSAGYAQAFLVGESTEYDVPVAGRLYLGLNQSLSDASTASGSFHVKIEIVGSRAHCCQQRRRTSREPSGGNHARSASKIPRRIADANGKPGDMVNVAHRGNAGSGG